jgi:hypothetical protein
MEVRRPAPVVVRLLVAHALAYPVALAWALGSIPFVVVGIASATGTALEDHMVAHRVLMRVAVPALASFVAMHAAGALWASSRDPRRARRVFAFAIALLAGVPVLVGGASWVWLMSL